MHYFLHIRFIQGLSRKTVNVKLTKRTNILTNFFPQVIDFLLINVNLLAVKTMCCRGNRYVMHKQTQKCLLKPLLKQMILLLEKLNFLLDKCIIQIFVPFLTLFQEVRTP